MKTTDRKYCVALYVTCNNKTEKEYVTMFKVENNSFVWQSDMASKENRIEFDWPNACAVRDWLNWFDQPTTLVEIAE